MKRALVTGASGDLGRAVVDRLTTAGFEVVAQVHRNAHLLARPAGGGLRVVVADLSSEPGVSRLSAALPAGWDALDLLVNCVGGARPVRFDRLSPAEWAACLALNVTAPYLVMRALLEHLERAGGAVINVASVAGLTGGAFGPHYATAKAAVIGLSRSAARELGPRGIRVNVVAPGPIDSRMTRALPDQALAAILADTALRRVLTPREVADAIVWLGQSSGITGQTVVVDGGRYFN